jgi:leucyl aminopeptidase
MMALQIKHEILVAPTSKLEQSLEKLSQRPELLTAAALAQWQKLSKAFKKNDSTASARLHFTGGDSLTVFFISPQVSSFQLHTELRKSLEDLFAPLPAAEGTRSLVLNLKAVDKTQSRRIVVALSALSQMAGWKPVSFGKKGEEHASANPILPALEWRTSLQQRELARLIFKGQSLGQANSLVRTLADLPSNELHPHAYRARAQAFAKDHGLSFEFWSISELQKKKAGAFLAVNRADPKSQAGIAVIKYQPKPALKRSAQKSKLPVVALVGKGLCFDTGGYNIKTGPHMYGMHGDMTGSALALALCGYFAKMKVPFEVHAYLALAENLISPTAYKPNDIVIACDGTSIEVIDTDAEGRMVLSDTLALVRRTQPSLCIDYATLTGAAIRSLDTRRGAVFSNAPWLARKAVTAGDESGERTWSFPIGEDYREILKSKVADLAQCGPGSNADHIYAATFLSHFIGNETPWLHLDLSTAENKGGLGLVSSDTTGFGVFWTDAIVDLALNEAHQKAKVRPHSISKKGRI